MSVILGCQVQNDLKTIGNRFWGSERYLCPHPSDGCLGTLAFLFEPSPETEVLAGAGARGRGSLSYSNTFLSRNTSVP